MSVLAFSLLPPPAHADPAKYREGDTLIEVGEHARDWVLQLASLGAGRLDASHRSALQSLVDTGEPELALLVGAIDRHGAAWVRRR